MDEAPSKNSSRRDCRSLDTPLSRSRRKYTSLMLKREVSDRHHESLGTYDESKCKPRSISCAAKTEQKPTVSRKRSISPARCSKRRQSWSHERSSGRSSVRSPTSLHRPDRSSNRGASPTCSRRVRSPSSDHGRSPSRSGSSDGAPKCIRKGRGFTCPYFFVRRYRSPSSDCLSIRTDHYDERNNRDR